MIALGRVSKCAKPNPLVFRRPEAQAHVGSIAPGPLLHPRLWKRTQKVKGLVFAQSSQKKKCMAMAKTNTNCVSHWPILQSMWPLSHRDPTCRATTAAITVQIAHKHPPLQWVSNIPGRAVSLGQRPDQCGHGGLRVREEGDDGRDLGLVVRRDVVVGLRRSRSQSSRFSVSLNSESSTPCSLC